MATDNMVWNIRSDEIVEQIAALTPDASSIPPLIGWSKRWGDFSIPVARR